jgi:hypothetical protein
MKRRYVQCESSKEATAMASGLRQIGEGREDAASSVYRRRG